MNSIIFRALGNETRLKIIETLMIKEHNVSDLTKISDKDQTTISRHLVHLKQAQLITQKKIGRNIHLKKRKPGKALPRFVLKMMGLNRVND